MPPRKSSPQPSYSKGGGSRSGRTTTAPKIATSVRAVRPAPTKVPRMAIAPHPKTLSNGQPRPKRRG